MIKIVIDTKGGDKGPSVIIKGAQQALEKYENLSVLLVGDGELIKKEGDSLAMPMDRVEILDAPHVEALIDHTGYLYIAAKGEPAHNKLGFATFGFEA